MSSPFRVVLPMHRRALLHAAFVVLASWAASAFAEEPAELDAAAKEIQGKWVRLQPTPDGPVRIVKEHRGHKTSLSAYDQKGNVLYAHESEFRIEVAGKVRILTFFNRKVTAGPEKGQPDAPSQSFLYRVQGDQFIETWGLLENDPGPPRMILWKRADNPPLGNEAAFARPRVERPLPLEPLLEGSASGGEGRAPAPEHPNGPLSVSSLLR